MASHRVCLAKLFQSLCSIWKFNEYFIIQTILHKNESLDNVFKLHLTITNKQTIEIYTPININISQCYQYFLLPIR